MTILEMEREFARLKEQAAANYRDWQLLAQALGLGALPIGGENAARAIVIEHARAVHATITSAPAIREDVAEFAGFMAAAMDSKKIERETRNEPHYMDPTYELSHAIACLKDKADQLEYWSDPETWRRVQINPLYPKKIAVDLAQRKERVKKTAVHLANFCMIIARKVGAGE